MKRRRRQVEDKLAADELLVCYSTFPRLGCDEFTSVRRNVQFKYSKTRHF